MEITSERQFNDIQVIDLDVAYPGELQTYTVRPEDTLERMADRLTLTFATGGVIVFNLQHAHWWAERQRVMRVPVDPPASKA